MIDKVEWVISNLDISEHVKLMSDEIRKSTACRRGWYVDYEIAESELRTKMIWSIGPATIIFMGMKLKLEIEGGDGRHFGYGFRGTLLETGKFIVSKTTNGTRQCNDFHSRMVLTVKSGKCSALRKPKFFEYLGIG